MIYDISSKGYSQQKNRVIKIEQGVREDHLMFRESLFNATADDPYKSQLITRIFSKVLRSKDGLNSTACHGCSAGACFSSMQFLMVPSTPKSGQSIPVYQCSDIIRHHDIIISIDSAIRVPIGDFRAVVIHDTLNNNLKFWNQDEGLLRIDNYTYPTDTLYLKMSERNFR